MRRTIGRLCMTIGALMLIAAFALFSWNAYEDNKAEKSITIIMPQLIEEIEHSNMLQECEIDGDIYIGYLSIPKLGLQLPILKEWDFNQLEVAPALYYGSYEKGHMVIAAHNYSRHFGQIDSLVIGETITFTAINNYVTTYEIVEIETLSPSAVEEMIDDQYDLTLFTCTYSGQNRTTIRCMKQK